MIPQDLSENQTIEAFKRDFNVAAEILRLGNTRIFLVYDDPHDIISRKTVKTWMKFHTELKFRVMNKQTFLRLFEFYEAGTIGFFLLLILLFLFKSFINS